MNAQPFTSTIQTLGLICATLFFAPAIAYGEGSMAFNSGTSGTSKLQNAGSANLLGDSNEITICAWVFQAGAGESGGGVIVALNASANSMSLSNDSDPDFLRFSAAWSMNPGVWSFEAAEDAWNAIAVTYSRSDEGNTPAARVNFVDVQADAEESPEGTSVNPGVGYCIGNVSGQTGTWDGRIAHVQIFDRILSAAEKDACLRAPGSIKHGLRLWLPMANASDTNDRSGNAFHATATAVATGSDTPIYDTLFQFGIVDETFGQIVIPSNGSEPAIGVRGVGVRSKLTASSALMSGTNFITTAGWGSTSTVVEPTVRDLYLDGNQNIPNTPFVNESTGTSPVCHAIAIDGDAAEVTGCKIFDFRGDGIHVKNSVVETSPMLRMPRIRDNKISHCYTGIRTGAVDSQITGNRVANVRDYCLLVPAGAGNIQSDGNHFFGAQTAIKVENSAGPFRSVNDTFSDAGIGLEVGRFNGVTQIVGGFTQRCRFRNILCKTQTSISNTLVKVAHTSTEHPEVIGVEFVRNGDDDASRSSFTGGCIQLTQYDTGTSEAGSTAGIKNAGFHTTIDTKIFGTPFDDEIGVWVPSAIEGGNFYIEATGFDETDDFIVKIDSEDIKYTKWAIVCSEADKAISIPANWDDTNSITVIRDGRGIVLTPGVEYPE